MSKFYGTIFGQSKTPATRCGSKMIRTAAQSWNGSVIVELYYNNDELMVDVEIDEGSAMRGNLIFSGNFDEFVEKLTDKKGEENV